MSLETTVGDFEGPLQLAEEILQQVKDAMPDALFATALTPIRLSESQSTPESPLFNFINRIVAEAYLTGYVRFGWHEYLKEGFRTYAIYISGFIGSGDLAETLQKLEDGSLELPTELEAGFTTLREYCTSISLGNLDTAIYLYTEALTLCPPDHPHRPNLLISLANAYCLQFLGQKKRSDSDSLSLATSCIQEAIQCIRLVDEARSFICVSSLLAIKILKLLDTINVEDMQEMGKLVEHFIGVEEETPAPTQVSEKGVQKHPDGVARVVELRRSSLSTRPAPHPLRLRPLVHLAQAIAMQWTWTKGEKGSLDEFLDLYKEAMELSKPSALHPDRPAVLRVFGFQSFAISKLRPIQYGDLDRSIELYRELLDILPLSDQVRPQIIVALSQGLRSRFEKKCDEKDLRNAEDLDADLKALGFAPITKPGSSSGQKQPEDGASVLVQRASRLASSLVSKFSSLKDSLR